MSEEKKTIDTGAIIQQTNKSNLNQETVEMKAFIPPLPTANLLRRRKEIFENNEEGNKTTKDK